MKRRQMIKNSLAATAGISLGSSFIASCSRLTPPSGPYAITMWDFSWLERRWPGAGYEDWNLALDELVERGYNAVRIDAYPHLIHASPQKKYLLKPVWNQQVWGSPHEIEIQVQPFLNEFISKCKDRGIKVGLSTWFREDTGNTRMQISSPEFMARIWASTLKSIQADGLLDALLYVDLCNEWPGSHWAPFFRNDPPEHTWGNWHSGVSMNWMKRSVELLRNEYPGIPLTYSFDLHNKEKVLEKDLSFLDFCEPHIWMSQFNGGEYYRLAGYNYELFSGIGYENMVKNGRRVYEERKDYWHEGLRKMIREAGELSEIKGLPLITTECWSVVDYKDWPGLEWDWILDLCETGVKEASSSGRWLAIATSNFCGPQFKGMWKEKDWHLRMTDMIKKSSPEKGLSLV